VRIELHHRIQSALLLAALALPASALGQGSVAPGRGATSAVVGQWKGETSSAGSVADVSYEFYPNGTYARKVLLVNEYGCTVEGDVLMMAPIVAATDSGATYGKASALRLAFRGDSLVATAGRERLHLHRVTVAVPESPLLGRWEGLTDMNEPVTQDFTADGRLIVSVVVSRAAGRYSMEGDLIVWSEQIPLPKRSTTRYRMGDGTLTLIVSPNLPPLELRKVDASIVDVR
jgi:hypothetical protein